MNDGKNCDDENGIEKKIDGRKIGRSFPKAIRANVFSAAAPVGGGRLYTIKSTRKYS